jgi:hypothetical protein
VPNKRNYTDEYKKHQSSTARKKYRAALTKKRREEEKKQGKAALKGKDISHKKPARSGGSNGSSNLGLRKSSANRSDNGHKKGETHKKRGKK